MKYESYQDDAKQPSSRVFVRYPERKICCCCKECGCFLGHISSVNGYLDGKCKKCSAFEVFISDEVGSLIVITEEASA